MKNEPTYHIDTTPEEDAWFREQPEHVDQPKKVTQGTFAKIFCAVFGIHILGAGLISLFSTSASANSTLEPKKTPEELPIAQGSAALIQAPAPTPTPSLPANQPATKPATSNHSKLVVTKEYTVKQGDTIYSIAKKYKLSTKRLLQINNIKDTNKIKVGQVLKFM